MSIPVEMEGGYPVTSDTRTTENPDDYPILVDGYGRQFVKVPVEEFVKMEVWLAAQGAAPRAEGLDDYPPIPKCDHAADCICIEPGHAYCCGTARAAVIDNYGAAPRAEGLPSVEDLAKAMHAGHGELRCNHQREAENAIAALARLAPQERRDKEGTE